MKVIFLDCDGVMNTPHWLPRTDAKAGDPWWFVAQLQRRLVDRVNAIADQAGAVAVLSTSWRHAFSVPVLQSIFHRAGLYVPIIGTTPSLSEHYTKQVKRCTEIAKWLEWTGVEDFVVLDDIQMETPRVAERSITIDPITGITDDNVRQAIRILTEGP